MMKAHIVQGVGNKLCLCRSTMVSIAFMVVIFFDERIHSQEKPDRPVAVMVAEDEMRQVVIQGNENAVFRLGLRREGDGEKNDWFNAWLFGGQNEQAIRTQLENSAALEIRRVLRTCDITSEQVDKLKFAASGDISRFFRAVEQAKSDAEIIKPNGNNVPEMMKAVQPLQQQLAQGIFDQHSLFHRVLESSLSMEQKQRREEQASRDRIQRQRVIVQSSLAQLQFRIPMTQSQRLRYLELAERVISKIQAPENLEFQAIQCAVLDLPIPEIETFLDENQVRAIVQSSEVFQARRNALQSQGVRFW